MLVQQLPQKLPLNVNDVGTVSKTCSKMLCPSQSVNYPTAIV